MRRGTRVAQAYIALTADGSNLDDDIAKELNKVDWREIGDENSEEYWKALKRGLEGSNSKGATDGLKRSFRRTIKNLDKAFKTDDTVKQLIENMLTVDDNRGVLTKAYKYVARQAGVEYSGEFKKVVKASLQRDLREALVSAAKAGRFNEDTFRELLGRTGTADGVELFYPGSAIESAIKRVAEVQRKVSAEEQANQEAWLRDQTKRWEKETKDAYKAVEREDAERKKRQDAMWVANIKFAEEFRRQQAKQKADEEKADKELWDARNMRARVHAQVLRQMSEGVDIGQFGDRRRRDDNMANRLGQLTGMGARNNFLNLMGRTVRTVTRMTTGLVRSIQSVSTFATSMFGTFQTGWKMVGEGASFAQKAMSGFGAVGSRMGKMFARLLTSLPALLASLALLSTAIMAVTLVASMLISSIAALLGIMTAFVSTIVSGATAALFVLAGAFSAVVAAGGLLTTAFMSMTDAQKNYLKDAFIPLREAVVGLGQIMITEMVPAFQTWSDNLQRAVVLAVPAAQRMGQAFAVAGNIITNSLSGPGFQRFATAMETYLPGITIKLSQALGNFLNGLMGTFAALMPFVDRFATYLSNVTQRFSEWANSAEGQNSIVEFMERAWESMKSLWAGLREFSGWVRDILFNPSVQEFGNTMFDGLADSFRRLRDNIKDGSLERWMQDAETFGRALWDAISGLWGVFEALNRSGVIDLVATALRGLGWIFGVVEDVLNGFVDLLNGRLPSSLAGAATLFNPLIASLATVVSMAKLAIKGLELLGKLPGVDFGTPTLPVGSVGAGTGATGGLRPTPAGESSSSSSARAEYERLLAALRRGGSDALRRGGADALPNTTPGSGSSSSSSASDPLRTPTFEWINPYKAWAESLIKDGPSLSKQIKDAYNKMAKQVGKAIKEAVNADSGADARSALQGMARDLRQTAKGLVETARSSLNSAATALANASTPEAAASALAAVRKAQADLAKAQKNQKRMNAQARILAKQREISSKRVNRLLAGQNAPNATLADYARARERLSNRLEDANQKLADAISMRNEFRDQISNATKSFGSIMSTQAKVVDGITQALTYSDITENLQDRLDRIRTFQANLRQLQAMGISDAAYQQIVEAGVEDGSAFAQAMLEGGAGAISQINNLVKDINSSSNALGSEASKVLYQAGVDAAQGLVDGLESLDRKLELAAGRLGKRIAEAVRKELGIRSPSRVLMADMDNVGDGAVIGLDNQHRKVIAASSRLASAIAVSPEVAAYEARQSAATKAGTPVSGNNGDPRFRDLIVHTPTENPKAVAFEVLNEVTARI